MIRGALLALLLAGAFPQERPPNIIVILTDDQGYGDLGCHGNREIRTPNLDAFAKQSVRAERFYVQPVCSPTRACLLTGRYNYRTGVVDTFQGRSMMHASETTLPEILGPAGYRSGLFGKWHLGDHYPLRAIDQGFQESLSLKGGGLGQASDPPGGDHYQDPTLYRNEVPEKTRGYVTDLIFDGAIAFVEKPRAEPFFEWIAPNAPHTPLETPPGAALEAGLDETTAKIYAMVRNIDENVGRLLRKLDELKLADDTIVIFMTDNGPQQKRFNGGMRGLKTTVFEGGIRVPFYVRWPKGGLKAGFVMKEPAAHIDLLPTLLEACGVKAPGALDGLSLLSRLRGEEKKPLARTLFFQWHRGDVPEEGRGCAAVERRWKWTQPGGAGVKPMLFDLADDPGETKDLSTAEPEVTARLEKAYRAWFRDVTATKAYLPPRIVIGTPHETTTLLTKQDRREDKPGFGHWEVEIAEAGSYEITARFPAAPAGSSWTLTWNGKGLSTLAAEGGLGKATLKLEAGAGALGGQLLVDDKPRSGFDYLELKKAP